MGIFDFLHKKRRNLHEFTEEERNYSLERRKQNAKLSEMEYQLEALKIQQDIVMAEQDLQELREPSGENVPDIENILISAILPKLLQNFLSPKKELLPPKEPLPVEDEKIAEILSSLDNKTKKYLRSLDETSFIRVVKPHLPVPVTEETLKRAYILLRDVS